MKKKKVIITLPAYNEARQISEKTQELYKFVTSNLKEYDVTIIIADNASNDATPQISKSIAKKKKIIQYFYTPIKGRGKVIYNLWSKKSADCFVYMDVDLSTDIAHLPDLISSILDNEYDIAIGTRNHKNSKVERSLQRTIISKSYIILLKLIFNLKVSDTQCGFKAFSSQAVKKLWPMMEPKYWKGSAWFFDAEVLIIAEKTKMKIYEQPVHWYGSSYTTVSLYKDILEDLRGILRMIRTKPWKK